MLLLILQEVKGLIIFFRVCRFTTGVRLVPCVVALLTFTLQPSMNIRALAHVQVGAAWSEM